MAAPQIGLGLGGTAGTLGTKYVNIDGTAVNSAVPVFVFPIDAGRPIYKAMADILSRLGVYPLNWVTASNNKSKYKLQAEQGTGSYVDIPDMAKTWAESGIKEGQTIKLVTAP